METNIILAGVGGQGILSISYVIDMTAVKQGLNFKQAEVHGMSQRGGAVQSHLRVSDAEIHSDLVPKGRGSLILSVEPLESLRYIEFLSPQGTVVTGIDPFINIPDYADVEKVLDTIASLQNHTLIPAERLARQAGSAKAQNMVLLGAASPYLNLSEELVEASIRDAFARKGEKIQATNIAAFRMGKAAGQAYRECLKAGMTSRQARVLVGRLSGGVLENEAVGLWKKLWQGPLAQALLEVLGAHTPGKFQGNVDVPKALLQVESSAKDNLAELLFKA